MKRAFQTLSLGIGIASATILGIESVEKEQLLSAVWDFTGCAGLGMLAVDLALENKRKLEQQTNESGLPEYRR